VVAYPVHCGSPEMPDVRVYSHWEMPCAPSKKKNWVVANYMVSQHKILEAESCECWGCHGGVVQDYTLQYATSLGNQFLLFPRTWYHTSSVLNLSQWKMTEIYKTVNKAVKELLTPDNTATHKKLTHWNPSTYFYACCSCQKAYRHLKRDSLHKLLIQLGAFVK
jgi:hypothetical protein